MNKEKVTFKHRDIRMAGDLYLPENFDKTRKYPAIVVTHPGGGVKEQVAGLYSSKIAPYGFVVLAFDAAYQGESGGEPRFLEDPASRVEDIRCAVDYLVTLPYVNEERIGALGICAGGGYTMNAVQTESRIKAAAAVSCADFGTLMREGMHGSQSLEELQKLLEEAARERTNEAKGGKINYMGIVPCTLEEMNDKTPTLYREGYDYYRTERGCNPHTEAKMPVFSAALLCAFSAFDFIDTVSPRPILLIAGSKADTLYFSEIAYKKAKEPKELYIIEGATHVDMYDKPQYVEPAVKKLIEFYNKYL